MKEKTRPKARIVVIDDHPLLSQGLVQLLCSQPDLECTGMADNTADARRLVSQSAPDLMILDLRLKGGDTLDLIKSLQVERPDLKVLVLSQYDEMLFTGRVLRAGASGYIMKETPPTRFSTPSVEYWQATCISASGPAPPSSAVRSRKSPLFRASASSDCPIASYRFSSLSLAPSVRGRSPSCR